MCVPILSVALLSSVRAVALQSVALLLGKCCVAEKVKRELVSY